MAATDAPITVRITANPADLDKALASAIRRIEAMTLKMEKGAAGVSQSLKKMGMTAEQSMKQTGMAATNLSYQLNDIGVSLAGGQSPFMVMMQQGAQVTQIFGQMRTAGLSMTSALVGAFRTVLNPMNLMIMALIAGVGYAFQFFTSVSEGAERSAEDVDATRKQIQGILKDLSTLDPAARAILDRAFEADRVKKNLDIVNQGIEDLKKNLKNLGEGESLMRAVLPLVGALTTVPAAQSTEANAAIDKLAAGWEKIKKAAAENGDVVGAFTEQMKNIDEIAKQFEGNDSIGRAIESAKDNLRALLPGFDDLLRQMGAMGKAAKAVQDAIDPEKTKAFNKALEDMGKIGVPALTELQKLAQAYADSIKNAQTWTERLNGTMAGLGALGRKMWEGMSDAADAEGDHLDRILGLLKEQEVFKEKAYPDHYASTGKFAGYRVGYGSDTYMDQGEIKRVTQDTVVTLEQAMQDLRRRAEEQIVNQIIPAIGESTWRSLNENQQEALLSLSYNYTHNFPDTVAKAIREGDKGQVAEAIAALTANPARRKKEAELYGGTEYDATPSKAARAYDDWAASIKKKTDAQIYANSVNADTNSSEYQRIFLIEKQKAVQEGLAAAKEQNLVIDEKLRAQIDAQATAMANAEARQRLLTDAKAADERQSQRSTQKLQELANTYNEMLASGISGFINDLRHGVDAGEAFSKMLDQIIGQLIEMAIKSMIMKSGFGQALASITGGFMGAKSGGTVGFTGLAKHRASPAVFAGAPRYASGGMVGYDPNAIPIIAHRGEVVVPTSAMRKAATQTRQPETTNIHAPTTIKVDVKNGGGTSVTETSSVAFADMVDRAVQGIIVRESRPGGLLRQQQGAR